MKIITNKKLKEECWNVNYELESWLNEHLKIFLEDASKHIDLKFHKFDYKDEVYTLEDLIIKLIGITEYLKTYHFEFDAYEKLDQYKNDMYEILNMIHFYLWW